MSARNNVGSFDQTIFLVILFCLLMTVFLLFGLVALLSLVALVMIVASRRRLGFNCFLQTHIER